MGGSYLKNFGVNVATGGIGGGAKWLHKAGSYLARQGIEILGDTTIDVGLYGNDLSSSLAWNTIGSIGGEAAFKGIGRGWRAFNDNFQISLRPGARTIFNSAFPLNMMSVSRRASRSGDDLADFARQDAQRHMREADLGLDPHDLEFYGGDGVIYEVPGSGTPSGRPYVGSADDLAQRARTATDGRDRSIARQVGSYPVGNRDARRLAEQTAIDDQGGIEMLDNLRNEIGRRSGN